MTLRHQWTDKLQLSRLNSELPVGVHVSETNTPREVQLECSKLGDLYEAVSKTKELVIGQLVGSSSSFRSESTASSVIRKTSHDNREMDQETNEDHKEKEASVEGEKTLNVEDEERDDIGPDTAEHDNRKTANDRKEEQLKEKRHKQEEVPKPEQQSFPARDEARSYRQRLSTEGSELDGDNSHDETSSAKSQPETAAESAQAMQTRTRDTEPCEGSHTALVKEQSKQFQDNASENDISSNDDAPAVSSEILNEKYLMDESLWAYVQFIDPQSKWDKKFLDTEQKGQTVELTGSSTDIEKLKKFCDTSRFQRAVIRTMQRVPDRCTAKAFRHDLHTLSENKVLVRLVDDPHYCEFVGKKSDIAELEKAIFRSYPEIMETKKIPEQTTTPTWPPSASPVTTSNSLALPPPAAAAGSSLSRGLGEMPARMTQQVFEAELDFQTALAHLRVKIVTGDLLKWRCEVLVDSCDSQMRHEGGLARLFAKAAGYEMQAECNAYRRKHGYLPQCGVMDTTAGNLQPPVRRLMHACGPNSNSYHSQDECGNMLEMTFLKCLLHANDVLRARSIALPAVSSGTS